MTVNAMYEKTASIAAGLSSPMVIFRIRNITFTITDKRYPFASPLLLA